jgi:FAD dependent oxidoreductase TIGR03364
MTVRRQFDLAIVGGGILGLAHALAATRHGLRAVVIERDARAVGASIRNFGFVTVTGQAAGITWRRAMRSRDVWAEVAPRAGIAMHHRGLLMCAIRPEALLVLEEFAAGPMGEGCRIVGRDALAEYGPAVRPDLAGALYSPHERRVESRDAIGQLTAWLEAQGVAFLAGVAAHGVAAGRIATSAGDIAAPRIVVCPGTDLATLFPDIVRRRQVTLCKLHMLRVAAPGWRLPAAIMSDLGLVRYLGYAACPSLPALRARLERERAAHLADGIHLIAVQSADGSLVVGDSHHYGAAHDPFQPRDVDDRIIEELRAVLDIPAPDIRERWVGVYPSGPDIAFTEAPEDGVRLVMVTSGTGASTAFAIAEETLADLLGLKPPPHAHGDDR